MNDFSDFMVYFNDHIKEVSYDTFDLLRNEWKPTLTLSQDNIALVTKISQRNTLAILRQYHTWMIQSQQ